MAYNEKLAGRIREALSHLPKVEEKKNVPWYYIYGGWQNVY
jgi:hypothetical protein